MTVDDLTLTERSEPPAPAPVWLEVGHVSRSVDRQLECLRSILAAADVEGATADHPRMVRT